MFDPDTDTYAYWFGYMFATVKKTASDGDALSIATLRQFCDHSRFATDADREVLEATAPGFSRKVPDTPALRLAGVFACNPDERGDAA